MEVHADLPSAFHLNVYNPKIQTFAAEFLTASGRVTVIAKTASLFKISNYGGLSTADEETITTYMSASDDVKSMPWRMGLSLSTIYSGFNLTTTEHGQVLTWENEGFDGGRARFCQKGSKVLIVFKGNKPRGCSSVDLLAYRDK